MDTSIYIRPLVIEDALVSCHWRNNPKLWRFTGSRPDKFITPEIETEWLSKVLQKEDEKRFAICLTENDKYIGNVFFTDIKDNQAELHIFIGDIASWGKGRAYAALGHLIEYGFGELKLESAYARISPKNGASLHLRTMLGLKQVDESFDESVNMVVTRSIFTREMYNNKEHLKHADVEL